MFLVENPKWSEKGGMQERRASALVPSQCFNLAPKFKPQMPSHYHSAFMPVSCFIFGFFVFYIFCSRAFAPVANTLVLG